MKIPLKLMQEGEKVGKELVNLTLEIKPWRFLIILKFKEYVLNGDFLIFEVN